MYTKVANKKEDEEKERKYYDCALSGLVIEGAGVCVVALRRSVTKCYI